MAELDVKDRSAMHVLAFLLFRMGANERAGRIYAALSALPPPYPGGEACDSQALLGLAAVALERGAADEALTHLRMLLRHSALASAAGPRKAALTATAHLLRAQALRAVGHLEESAIEARLYQSMTEQGGDKRAVQRRP